MARSRLRAAERAGPDGGPRGHGALAGDIDVGRPLVGHELAGGGAAPVLDPASSARRTRRGSTAGSAAAGRGRRRSGRRRGCRPRSGSSGAARRARPRDHPGVDVGVVRDRQQRVERAVQRDQRLADPAGERDLRDRGLHRLRAARRSRSRRRSSASRLGRTGCRPRARRRRPGRAPRGRCAGSGPSRRRSGTAHRNSEPGAKPAAIIASCAAWSPVARYARVVAQRGRQEGEQVRARGAAQRALPVDAAVVELRAVLQLPAHEVAAVGDAGHVGAPRRRGRSAGATTSLAAQRQLGDAAVPLGDGVARRGAVVVEGCCRCCPCRSPRRRSPARAPSRRWCSRWRTARACPASRRRPARRSSRRAAGSRTAQSWFQPWLVLVVEVSGK